MLSAAVQGGHKQLVDLLIERGADINAATKWGETVLDIAVAKGRKNIVSQLIMKGARTQKQLKIKQKDS